MTNSIWTTKQSIFNMTSLFNFSFKKIITFSSKYLTSMTQNWNFCWFLDLRDELIAASGNHKINYIIKLKQKSKSLVPTNGQCICHHSQQERVPVIVIIAGATNLKQIRNLLSRSHKSYKPFTNIFWDCRSNDLKFWEKAINAEKHIN